MEEKQWWQCLMELCVVASRLVGMAMVDAVGTRSVKTTCPWWILRDAIRPNPFCEWDMSTSCTGGFAVAVQSVM